LLTKLLVQSIGGPVALDSLVAASTFRAIGTADLNGQKGRFTEVFAAPDRFFLEVTLGPVQFVQAYDGFTAWQRDHNGRVSELHGYEKIAGTGAGRITNSFNNILTIKLKVSRRLCT
jgi:hypothetical protein